ncbi:MAG: hypothetical protein ACYTHJ_02785 [Planctomycetota bacterium]|jgi:apolipoprotein N-acyltransferase
MSTLVHRFCPELDVSAAALAKGAAICTLLVAGAIATIAAIQTPAFAWLGWLALLPLLFAIRVLSPGKAALAGAFWGVSFFLIAGFAGKSLFAPTLLSAVLLTLIPGVYAGIGSLITRQVGFSPLILSVGWVLVELALHPIAMQHGLLASTQGEGFVFRIVGHVAGYAIVAFLVAYVTASLLSVLGGVYAWVRSRRLVASMGALHERINSFESRVLAAPFIGSWQARGPPLPAYSRAG